MLPFKLKLETRTPHKHFPHPRATSAHPDIIGADCSHWVSWMLSLTDQHRWGDGVTSRSAGAAGSNPACVRVCATQYHRNNDVSVSIFWAYGLDVQRYEQQALGTLRKQCKRYCPRSLLGSSTGNKNTYKGTKQPRA